MGPEKPPRPTEKHNGMMLTRRRAHSEDEPLEGPSRAPPIGLYAFRAAKGLLVPQAITASRGFARREGASHICVGRVDIEC